MPRVTNEALRICDSLKQREIAYLKALLASREREIEYIKERLNRNE